MMTFQVVRIHDSEVYKDIARIPARYRLDTAGKPIPEGRICKVTVRNASVLLSVRGQTDHQNAAIHVDEVTRRALGVAVNEEVSVELRPVWWIGQVLWAWNASDPASRIAARLGILSFTLGVIGLVLGAVGVGISLR